MAERMTGGQAIVRTLIQKGIDTIFGLPGVQLDNTFDALYEARNAIRTIHTRHEQAAQSDMRRETPYSRVTAWVVGRAH